MKITIDIPDAIHEDVIDTCEENRYWEENKLSQLDRINKTYNRLIALGLTFTRTRQKYYTKKDYIYSNIVYCNSCDRLTLGYGAEYYSGDVCRCAKCIREGRKYTGPGTEILEGIIGVDYDKRQYNGQPGLKKKMKYEDD